MPVKGMVPETATEPAPGYVVPIIQGGGFNQAQYDALKRYSPQSAEAYKAATLGKAQAAVKPAEAPKPAPKAGDVGYYSPQSARLIETAAKDVPKAAEAARGMVAAPPSLGFKMPEAAPDPSEEYGGLKDIEAAPDPSEVYGGVVEPYAQPAAESPKAIADSAKELAGASPAKVGDVIDKLKAEEARGGPGFWDVLQAAAAGWQGQVPLYVQKELARKEEEAALARAREVMGLEASQRAEERTASQAFQRELAREEMENRLKLAGIGTVQGMGGLSLGDLMIPGAGGK